MVPYTPPDVSSPPLAHIVLIPVSHNTKPTPVSARSCTTRTPLPSAHTAGGKAINQILFQPLVPRLLVHPSPAPCATNIVIQHICAHTYLNCGTLSVPLYYLLLQSVHPKKLTDSRNFALIILVRFAPPSVIILITVPISLT